MATRDGQVDLYIREAAPFAQPDLEHLRGAVHAACPDETRRRRIEAAVARIGEGKSRNAEHAVRGRRP